MNYLKMRIRPPLLYAYKNTFVYLVVLFFSVRSVSGQNSVCNFRNPKNICGTSIAELFQVYYRIGDFESMLKFTSSRSISLFGKTPIEEKFRKMEFGYQLHLIACSSFGKTYHITYSTRIYGTEVVIRIESEIENDSAKIVLPADFLDETIFLYK